MPIVQEGAKRVAEKAPRQKRKSASKSEPAKGSDPPAERPQKGAKKRPSKIANYLLPFPTHSVDAEGNQDFGECSFFRNV
jgi:hypothetical protein